MSRFRFDLKQAKQKKMREEKNINPLFQFHFSLERWREGRSNSLFFVIIFFSYSSRATRKSSFDLFLLFSALLQLLLKTPLAADLLDFDGARSHGEMRRKPTGFPQLKSQV